MRIIAQTMHCTHMRPGVSTGLPPNCRRIVVLRQTHRHCAIRAPIANASAIHASMAFAQYSVHIRGFRQNIGQVLSTKIREIAVWGGNGNIVGFFWFDWENTDFTGFLILAKELDRAVFGINEGLWYESSGLYGSDWWIDKWIVEIG